MAAKGKQKVRRTEKSFQINRVFDGMKRSADDNRKNVKRIECAKYKAALAYDGQNLLVQRAKAFVADDMVLIQDSLTLSDDPCVPTVVVVVKNERERMRVFYDHYRKLGVHQFVVLDNASDDGTLEFLINQSDTRVYQTTAPFQTQKKEGWIEKLLTVTGYNRWYVIVDSDELLDYIGSEDHSVERLIRKVNASGVKRIGGYMLDMYAKEPLFSGEREESLLYEPYRYFDKAWYYTRGDMSSSNSYVTGGPRFSKLGMLLALGKQPVFFFDDQTLYRDCHSLYPILPKTEMPALLVLRHYKFLPRDLEEYHRRLQEKNFYNDSIEYRMVLEAFERNMEICLYSEESSEYVDSYSLRGLPYLEEVSW